MNRHLRTPLLGCVVALAFAGCSYVRVTRVATPRRRPWYRCYQYLNPSNLFDDAFHTGPVERDEHASGLRYFLPKPYILVKPDGQGGVSVQPVYIPDHTQEYAVTSSVSLAKHDLTLSMGDGLLKQVTYKPTTTDVAEHVIAESQKVLAQLIADEKAKRDAEAEAKKARQDAISGAEQAIRGIEDALEIACYDLEQFDRVHAPPLTPEDQTSRQRLERVVKDNEIKLRRAREKLDALKATRANSSGQAGTSPGDVVRPAGPQGAVGAPEPAPAPEAPAKPNTAAEVPAKADDDGTETNIHREPGPALYEIVEGANGVTLRPVNFELLQGDGSPSVGPQAGLNTYTPVTVDSTPLSISKISGTQAAPTHTEYVLYFLFNRSVKDLMRTVDVIPKRGRRKPTLHYLKQGESPGQESRSGYFTVTQEKLEIHLPKDIYTPGEYIAEIEVAGVAEPFKHEVALLSALVLEEKPTAPVALQGRPSYTFTCVFSKRLPDISKVAVRPRDGGEPVTLAPEPDKAAGYYVAKDKTLTLYLPPKGFPPGSYEVTVQEGKVAVRPRGGGEPVTLAPEPDKAAGYYVAEDKTLTLYLLPKGFPPGPYEVTVQVGHDTHQFPVDLKPPLAIAYGPSTPVAPSGDVYRVDLFLNRALAGTASVAAARKDANAVTYLSSAKADGAVAWFTANETKLTLFFSSKAFGPAQYDVTIVSGGEVVKAPIELAGGQ